MTGMNTLHDSLFSTGITCPRRHSNAIRWHGKDKLRQQRYYCNSCRRTFNDRTGTAMARTRYLDKWQGFARCMREHHSCRAAAALLGVSHKTTFRWRHKLLDGLRRKAPTSVGGIVETDETYVVRYYKGSTLPSGKPCKRGPTGGTISRGLGHNQVAILNARSRDGEMVSITFSEDTLSKDSLLRTFGLMLDRSSVLCTDGSAALAAFARELAIEHHVLNASKKE